MSTRDARDFRRGVCQRLVDREPLWRDTLRSGA
jgi:hypothetical protein